MKVEKTHMVALVALLRYGRLQRSEIAQIVEGGDRAARAVYAKLLEIPGIYTTNARDLCTFYYITAHRIPVFYGTNMKEFSLRECKHRSIPRAVIPSSLEAMQEFYT